MVDRLEFQVMTKMDRMGVRDKLQSVTGKATVDYRISKPTHLYEGTVNENGFIIRRVGGTRSLLPKLCGRFDEGSAGTKVIVETKLKEVVVSMIGMATGLMLPGIAILSVLFVIGNMKIVVICVLAMIIGAIGGYIMLSKNALEKEFMNDHKIITKLLCVDE